MKTVRRRDADKVRQIECPGCGAGVGELCWGEQDQQIKRVHRMRAVRYERTTGKRPKLAGKVRIKFVCPICGGPHARGDHQEQAA